MWCHIYYHIVNEKMGITTVEPLGYHHHQVTNTRSPAPPGHHYQITTPTRTSPPPGHYHYQVTVPSKSSHPTPSPPPSPSSLGFPPPSPQHHHDNHYHHLQTIIIFSMTTTRASSTAHVSTQDVVRNLTADLPWVCENHPAFSLPCLSPNWAGYIQLTEWFYFYLPSMEVINMKIIL